METNRLVTSGYYACMRHPMHLGLLFFPWSVALIFGSVTFILLLAPLEMLSMIIMIKLLEENEAGKKLAPRIWHTRKKRLRFLLELIV